MMVSSAFCNLVSSLSCFIFIAVICSCNLVYSSSDTCSSRVALPSSILLCIIYLISSSDSSRPSKPSILDFISDNTELSSALSLSSSCLNAFSSAKAWPCSILLASRTSTFPSSWTFCSLRLTTSLPNLTLASISSCNLLSVSSCLDSIVSILANKASIRLISLANLSSLYSAPTLSPCSSINSSAKPSALASASSARSFSFSNSATNKSNCRCNSDI